MLRQRDFSGPERSAALCTIHICMLFNLSIDHDSKYISLLICNIRLALGLMITLITRILDVSGNCYEL